MKEEQLKLCSVLNHDTEPIQEKTRKKISQKDKKKRGNSIAKESKDQVGAILKSLKINEDERLKKWQVK